MSDKTRVGVIIEEMAETIVRLRRELDDMSQENSDLTLELSSPKRAETIEKLSRQNAALKKRLRAARAAVLELLRERTGMRPKEDDS